jgi:solute carrier family 35, member F5
LFEEGFDKPFLVTYLNTASFALYLIPFLYRHWRYGGNTKVDIARHEYEPLANEPTSPVLEQELSHREASGEDLPPLTTRETAQLATVFCLLWFIANWTVNASLSYTSVGSSTVLASTSGLFTMIMSRLLGIEGLSAWKISAVIGRSVQRIQPSFVIND